MPARDLAQSDVALIDGFADHLALERHLATSTVDAYRRDLSQLAAFLRRSRRDLPGAEIDDLRRFLAQLTSLGYARASIARRVGAIHTFYRWAVSQEVVAEDPAALLGRPKVVNRLPVVLRVPEAAALVEAPVVSRGRERRRRCGGAAGPGDPRADVRVGAAGERGRRPHDRPGRSRTRPGDGGRQGRQGARGAARRPRRGRRSPRGSWCEASSAPAGTTSCS